MSYIEIAEPLISATSNIFSPAWYREASRPVWARPRVVDFPDFTVDPTALTIPPEEIIDVSWMPSFPSVITITYAAVPSGQGAGGRAD
jgi:hypothetical protein